MALVLAGNKQDATSKDLLSFKKLVSTGANNYHTFRPKAFRQSDSLPSGYNPWQSVWLLHRPALNSPTEVLSLQP